MLNTYAVKFKISDRGSDYPVMEREVVVQKEFQINTQLTKDLMKDRRAMDLTKNFNFTILSKQHTGWK